MFWSRFKSITSLRTVARGILNSRGCSDVPAPPTEGEIRITSVLMESFPKASSITVDDVSGGCGSMYDVKIVAEEFKGLRAIKQHRLVTEALREEIRGMHGITIITEAPK